MSSKAVNTSNSRRPDGGLYSSVISRIQQEGSCPFCPERFFEEHGLPTLVQGSDWLATNNKYPYYGTEHHYLLLHKKHIETIGEISIRAWTDLYEVITGLTEQFNIQGAVLLMRYGNTDYTGATVNHLHAQLVSGSGNPEAEPILTKVGNKVIASVLQPE